MATRRIREFLDGNGVHYEMVNHAATYTAQEAAESTHIHGQYMAKTVIVWIDGQLAMVVVPANKVVDLEALAIARHAENVRLAEEAEFKDRFVGCQVGTVPPFGNLFGVETLYDSSLAYRPYIAFAAGTHTDVIVMRFGDYNRLVRPMPVQVAVDPMAAVASHVPQL